MPLYGPENSPAQNLEILSETAYPGRLLLIGWAAETAVLGYALTGRSPGSRNRYLTDEDGVIGTWVADTSLPTGDPELTIYDAMRRVGDMHVVSNGNQTDTVVRYVRSGKSFADAMAVTEHEPDELGTPRISGYLLEDADDDQSYFGISVIRKNPDGEGSLRSLYTDTSPEIAAYEDQDGVGFAVHTYKGTDTDVESFDEPPFVLPVHEEAQATAEMLWGALDPRYRVAVAVKTIALNGEITVAIIDPMSDGSTPAAA